MNTGFVSTAPVSARRHSAGVAVQCPRTASGVVKMSADDGDNENKKMSFGTWLLSKFMHNQDEVFGYEPIHKAAMKARDAEKVKRYQQQIEEKMDQKL